MLSIFINPDEGHSNRELVAVLDAFIAWVGTTLLPPTTKDNAIKILESLRWIKVNRAGIKLFIDNKADYLPLLTAKDRRNGVVRDHLGTSIHFNSYTGTGAGDRAVSELSDLINLFERAYVSWQASKPLILMMLIAKCNYDKEVGCIEARMVEPMRFLGAMYSTDGILTILDLIHTCQALYFINVSDDTYNFIMADDFFAPFYGTSVFDLEGRQATLLQGLVFESMATVLSYNPPSPERFAEIKYYYREHPVAFRKYTLNLLTENAIALLGSDGAFEYRFTKQNDAEQLALWLRRCDCLQMYHIDKCRVIEQESFVPGSNSYLVRLLPMQREVLTAESHALITGSASVVATAVAESSSALTSALPAAVGATTAVADEVYYQELFDILRSKNHLAWLNFIDRVPLEVLDWLVLPHFLTLVEKLGETAMLALIAKTPPKTLDEAVYLHDSSGITALHYACAHQSSTVMQALVAKISSSTLRTILLQVNPVHGTLLHWVTRYQDVAAINAFLSKVFSTHFKSACLVLDSGDRTIFHVICERNEEARIIALLRYAPAEIVETVFSALDKGRCTLLNHLLFYQYNDALQLLFGKLSDKAIKEAFTAYPFYLFDLANTRQTALFVRALSLVERSTVDTSMERINVRGANMLHLIFAHHDITALTLFLEKASPGYVRDILTWGDEDDNRPFHSLIQNFDVVHLMALLAKVPFKVLVGVFSVRNMFHEIPFYQAIKSLSREQLHLFMEVIPPALLNEIAFIQDAYGRNAAMHLALKRDDEALFTLLRRVHPNVVKTLITQRDNMNRNLLYFLAYYQKEAALLSLLSSVERAVLLEAGARVDDAKSTLLHVSAHHQDSRACQILLNFLPIELLNRLFVVYTQQGSPLHCLASYQDNPAFMAGLCKASSAVVSSVLTHPMKYGRNLLLVAAVRFDYETLLLLLNKASSEALTYALTQVDLEGRTALHHIAERFGGELLALLLSKTEVGCLSKALYIRNHLEQTSGWIQACLETSTQAPRLAPWLTLLNQLSETNTWTEGRPLSELSAALDELLTHPDLLVRTLVEALRRLMPRILSSDHTLVLTEADTAVALTLADTTPIVVGSLGWLTAIERKGLSSWTDFYRLQRYSNQHGDHEALQRLVRLMARYQVLTPSVLAASIAPIHNELKDGHLLIKVISDWQPGSWTLFLSQLENPSIRPSLRTKPSRTETHKLNLLTNEIHPYIGKEAYPGVTRRTHAKKQSSTLITPEARTPLFQSHHEDSLLVGVCLRADPDLDPSHPLREDKAKLSALLEQDSGTYYRQWRGSLDKVRAYARKVKNHTSLAAFKRAIQDNCDVTNEVLMKPSRGSLLSVVLGGDTPKERLLAKQYQADLERRLGLKVPITFYSMDGVVIEDLELYEALNARAELGYEKERLLSTEPLRPVSALFTLFAPGAIYNGINYPYAVAARLRELDEQLAKANRLIESRVAPPSAGGAGAALVATATLGS